MNRVLIAAQRRRCAFMTIHQLNRVKEQINPNTNRSRNAVMDLIVMRIQSQHGGMSHVEVQDVRKFFRQESKFSDSNKNVNNKTLARTVGLSKVRTCIPWYFVEGNFPNRSDGELGEGWSMAARKSSP